MNIKEISDWTRVCDLGLSTVPAGEFGDFAPYRKRSKQPAHIRKLPVLRGAFRAKHFDFKAGLPNYVGWGVVGIGAAEALTFRIQVGPAVLYWLANTCDAKVWKVMDQWAAADAIVLAADFDDGRSLVVTRDYQIAPVLENYRSHIKDASQRTPLFVAEATQALAMDDARNIASSDIAAYATLEHFQACLVRTEYTQPLSGTPLHGGHQ